MKKLAFSILLSCIAAVSMAQVFQTNNIPYKFRGVKGDSLVIIPTGVDTPYTTNPKWGENSTGALFLRTSDSSLWGKIGNRYSRITGAGGGGVNTIGTISGSGNANGLSISGSTLTAHPATATTAGMVTTGAQTWAGVKTFNDAPQMGVTSVLNKTKIILHNQSNANYAGIGMANSAPYVQNFANSAWGWSWNSGDSLQPSGTNEMMKLTSAGLDITSNVNLFSQGSTTNRPAQYWYNNGAGNRMGVGIANANPYTQFFSPTANGWSWNGGGDLQPAGTNEYMRLNSTGLVVTVPASFGDISLISQGKTYPAAKQYYYNDGAGNRMGMGVANTSPFIQSFGANSHGWSWNIGGDLQTTGTNELMRLMPTGDLSIGSTSPSASAILSATSTTRGFLPPRLTATQRNAIATPAAGLMVYDTDSSRYMLYGSSWKGLAYTDAGGGGGGSTTSASGTGISLVNGSSLVKRLKAGFNTIVMDNTDSVTISRDTLTQTLTDGATVTFSATAGVSARVTLAGNRTLSITNMNNGMYLTLVVIQDGTGGRTLTLPAGVKVVNGGAGAVTLSSAANTQDILTFFEINNVTYCNIGRNYN